MLYTILNNFEKKKNVVQKKKKKACEAIFAVFCTITTHLRHKGLRVT